MILLLSARAPSLGLVAVAVAVAVAASAVALARPAYAAGAGSFSGGAETGPALVAPSTTAPKDASNAGQSDKEAAEAAAEDCVPRKRSGVVLALTLGGGIAHASGYPNNASLIGTPADYSSSALMAGGGFTFNLMGALTDWISFGIWFGSETYSSKNWRSTGGGGGFRVETHPLAKIYPHLDGLAVFGNFGLGAATLRVTAPGNYPNSDGTQSFIGVGALYEWNLGHALGGHFALGPSLEYDAIYSQALDRNGALLGGRLAWYGGG